MHSRFRVNPNELRLYLTTCELTSFFLLNSLFIKRNSLVRFQTVITRNFADQGHETYLNRDVVLMSQIQNENQAFYDRILNALNQSRSFLNYYSGTETEKNK